VAVFPAASTRHGLADRCRYPRQVLRFCTGFAGELAWWQGWRWLEH
jgi:hypothetical protein